MVKHILNTDNNECCSFIGDKRHSVSIIQILNFMPMLCSVKFTLHQQCHQPKCIPVQNCWLHCIPCHTPCIISLQGETFLKYDDRFSAVKFTLHWSRKPLYFYINIIVPTAFMGLITLGVFWLPAECGEKMSLGITVVLAFSVFQIVIMEITPVSSDAVPKISELLLLTAVSFA